MAFRFGHLKQISRIMRRVYSGNHYQQSRRVHSLHNSLPIPLLNEWENINRVSVNKWRDSQRFSTVSQISEESSPEVDLSSFIESTLDELEGPSHCWLNKVEDIKDFYTRGGVFLVLVGAFLGDSLMSASDSSIMFHKVKLLQQRYPLLQVMGFQPACSISSVTTKSLVTQKVLNEHITFPILLSNKTFTEMKNGAVYILFQGLMSTLYYHEGDMDLGILQKAMEELKVTQSRNHKAVHNLKTSWSKQTPVIKEPYICSSLRNLLLYFPGCISVDESGSRLFLSDSNHHRIIVADAGGRILDCIGSSPGFEDGEFESAKLVRPAGSIYHTADNCLYFVDSENHTIRRADMDKRIVETIYPTGNDSKKPRTVWNWIMDKLGMKQDMKTTLEDHDSGSMMFPWHIIESSDSDFLIIDRSFEILWVMDLASGVTKEVIKGSPKILELYGQMIIQRISMLKQIPKQTISSNYSTEDIPCAGLLSSLAALHDHIIICDPVGHRIVKFNRESGVVSNFQLSNYGILGLPYWLASSLERVCAPVDPSWGAPIDHLQRFSLLPGMVDIDLVVEIPVDTELVEPLQEGCIWRQARGTATEVFGTQNIVASSDKVGVAQQWYDELDNFGFATPESEPSLNEENTTSDQNLDEDRIHFSCTVNTSPGMSEVIIYAALYLRLKRSPESSKFNREKKATRIADIISPESCGRMRRHACIHSLLNSNGDLEDLVFLKPLHVRIKIDGLDHPKADNLKDTILTDSSVEVNVSLN